ncbi:MULTISPECIES: restriction endonuclease subunit S [Neisseria]|uniref:restriction endonuclease subunit S n=1 Tax=Neisseria TaxID=482 RepID=UPI0008A4EB6E|nr:MULTISPECIES: restriction endonuclease subunit S [Neisseria]OFV33951.1 restriction endonuclease subunit S [Neisseria sp. HMSC15G01]
MNKQQEPRLRFKGFTGAWEEKVLGENASFTKGSGYSKSDLTDSGFPIILYGRLYTKYENIIENVDTFVSCDKNALKSLGNEVIVPASGETAEDIARASAVYQQDVILGGDLNIITPNENIASPFLALTLTNGKSNQELAKKAQGKSVVHLRNDDLRACKISFPSFLEQTHLGLFFRRLDNQIAESRAVLKKSRQLKKAMLAKMFPANGEKIPKIRFKGFEGGWKREILKDVVNVFDNLRIPVSENKRTSGNTPYFGANGIQDYVDGFTHNGEFVLIAEDGANDLKNYPVQYVNGKCWVNNHAHILQGKSEILNNIFLFSRFQSMDISQFLVGGGRAKLNGSTMLEIEIEFPKDKKEQTAIGLFFRQLDETIALQTAEVEKLNQLKKGLLAAMLV